MIHYPEYTLTLPPSCPTNQDHLTLRDRGVKPAKLAVGDGALGFWSALAEVYPETRVQRCWVRKTANVLDKLPKRLQAGAKSMLHEIWQAETRKSADQALDRFVATYEANYPKAADCLARDRETLLAFYDLPAAHWQHLRTSNPIESTFGTIRLRTALESTMSPRPNNTKNAYPSLRVIPPPRTTSDPAWLNVVKEPATRL